MLIPPDFFEWRNVAEGEVLGMRLSDDDAAMADDASTHVNEFLFDDGGMRGLAAAMCWCGLVYFVQNLPEDVACDSGVAALARSLLAIPTYYKRPGPDPARAMIGRIIRQNVEAKKMAVSSFEWARILSNMVGDGEKITMQQAIEMYNTNPEVAAHGGSAAKEPWIIDFQYMFK